MELIISEVYELLYYTKYQNQLCPIRLQTRQNIAAKQFVEDIKHPYYSIHSDEIKNILRYSYPPWMFYTDKNTHTHIYRIFTVIQKNDHIEFIGYQANVFGNAFVNLTMNEIIPIKSWSQQQYILLTSGYIENPHIFVDPLAWKAIVFPIV